MKKGLKISLFSIGGAILLIILLAASYLLYVIFEYSRHDDNIVIAVVKNKDGELFTGQDYTAITYNLGFGAYSPEYSFFMDSAETLDGKKVNGKYGKGISKADVLANVAGSVELIKKQSADFALIQEVDIKSSRAFKINQLDHLATLNMAYTFAENFHSAYLFYPFTNPHGKTNAGLVSMSNYKIESAVRRSFTVDESFPTKFFDLDRCFSIQYIPVSNGKKLALFNIHMSAYDEGGKIRTLQLAELNAALASEREKGNYVVAGGDFNHDIANSKNAFPTTFKVPDDVYSLENKDLSEGFKFAAPTNAASCRWACAPFVPNESYTLTLDGFIVSDNILIKEATTVDNGFAYSDHNLVKLSFQLSADNAS